MFETWFSRNGGVGWTIGLDDLRGPFQNDSELYDPPRKSYISGVKLVFFKCR